MTNNNPEDEDEEEIVNENMYDSDVVDPLSDPLAIDDVVLNQSSENDGGEGGGSEFASTNTTLTELDSSADGQIILVDVNSLKNAFPATMPTVSYANCTSNGSSGSSGNTCTTSTPSHSRTSRDTFDPVDSGLALNVSSDDGIGVAFEPIALALDDDEINDEIEGVRSDGSDSGLGLELSAGLILDKPNTSSTGTNRVDMIQCPLSTNDFSLSSSLPLAHSSRGDSYHTNDGTDCLSNATKKSANAKQFEATIGSK